MDKVGTVQWGGLSPVKTWGRPVSPEVMGQATGHGVRP